METKINEVIDSLKKSIADKNINPITRILNIQFHLGKYFALMDILSEENIDKYIEIAENTRDITNEALRAIQKIYDYSL